MNGRIAREFRRQAEIRTIGNSGGVTKNLYKMLKKAYKFVRSK